MDNIKTFGEPPVPDWIVEEVAKARKALGIHQGWYISLALSETPHGSENVDGSSYSDVPYLQSGLEFKPDIQNNKSGRDLVWHEVAHVLIAPMREAAYKGLDQIKNKKVQKLAKRILDDAEEHVVNQLIPALMEALDAQ